MAAGVNLDISLIICTRDRCQQLARCLQAVQDIWLERSWELIIVDNGSTDHTVDVVHDFIRKTGIRAVYLFEPKPGKSIGLNAALRVAHGQILAFTDDDCYPAPDFLSRISAAFEDPSVGYVSGRILLHDPADHPFAINESHDSNYLFRQIIYPRRCSYRGEHGFSPRGFVRHRWV